MNRAQRRAAKVRGIHRERPAHADYGLQPVRPLTADSLAKLAAVTGQAGLTDIARLHEMADHAGLTDIAETLREMNRTTGLMCEITDRRQAITVTDLDQGVPALMVVNDYHHSTGPAPWRGAAALAEWSKFAVIQSTPGPFEAGAEAVESWERVVLVKTSAIFVQEWAARFRGKHVLTVLSDRFTQETPQVDPRPILPPGETIH